MVIGDWAPQLRDALTRGLVVGGVFTHAKVAKDAKPRQEHGVETHAQSPAVVGSRQGACSWRINLAFGECKTVTIKYRATTYGSGSRNTIFYLLIA